MKRFKLTLLILGFSFFAAMESFAQSHRVVTIPWRKVKGASQYEMQLSKSPEMLPVLFKKRLKRTKLKLKLKPATYYFRVRAIDSKNRVGPWTQVEGFSVYSSVPDLVSPPKDKVISKLIAKDGIPLKWQEGKENSEYLLEIRDKTGIIHKRTVEKSRYFYMPQKPGKYTWRIGYETAAGEEWGKARSFFVMKKAIPKDVKQVKVYIDEMQTPVDVGNSAGFSLIGRVAQALGNYSVSYAKENGSVYTTSAAPLIGVFSLEGRWRAKRSRKTPWLLSGSFNFEIMRPNFNNQVENLPRGYARVFVLKVNGRWKYGPLVHLHFGKGYIYVVEPTTSGSVTTNEVHVNTSVTRFGGGVGFGAVYQASRKVYLSVIALMRYDMGGSSDATGELNNELGFEAGFGVVFGFSESVFFEGRIRAQQENFSWTLSGAPSVSTFNQTYSIVDIGLGYHF